MTRRQTASLAPDRSAVATAPDRAEVGRVNFPELCWQILAQTLIGVQS